MPQEGVAGTRHQVVVVTGQVGQEVEGVTVASGNVLLGFDKVGGGHLTGRRAKVFYKSAFNR